MGTATGLRRLLVPLTDGADEATLQAIADVARGAGSVVRLLYVRPVLNEAAAWRADLVALSAGDRTWLSRAVHSGTAAKAFRKTGIPALLYTPFPNGSRKSEE